MSQRLCNDGVGTNEGRGKHHHHSARSEQLTSRTVTGGDGEDRAFRAVLRYEPGRAACLRQGDNQRAVGVHSALNCGRACRFHWRNPSMDMGGVLARVGIELVVVENLLRLLAM